MEYSITDFRNVIHFRNQIATLPEKELKDLYKDMDYYICFLNTFVIMTNIDSGFLLFSNDFLDKIDSVVEQNRFLIDDDQVRLSTNEIITYLNEVRGKDDLYRKTITTHYRIFQEDIRGVRFRDNHELINSLLYDPYVFDAIEDLDLSTIGEDKLFLASINSFLEFIPEMFNNSDVQELVKDKINEIGKKNKFYQRDMKKLVKDTMGHSNRVFKGE